MVFYLFLFLVAISCRSVERTDNHQELGDNNNISHKETKIKKSKYAKPGQPVEPQHMEYLLYDNGEVLTAEQLKEEILKPLFFNTKDGSEVTKNIVANMSMKKKQIIAFLLNRRFFIWNQDILYSHDGKKVFYEFIEEIVLRLDMVIAHYKEKCKMGDCPTYDGLFLTSDGFKIEDHVSVVAAFLGGITTVVWGLREISAANDSIGAAKQSNEFRQRLEEIEKKFAIKGQPPSTTFSRIETSEVESRIKKAQDFKGGNFYDYKSLNFGKKVFGPTLIGTGILILGLSVADLFNNK